MLYYVVICYSRGLISMVHNSSNVHSNWWFIVTNYVHYGVLRLTHHNEVVRRGITTRKLAV